VKSSGNTGTVRDGFAWRISVAMLIGYLLASVPQTYLDARLFTHILYPSRQYRFAYLIVPIAIAVFATSLLVAVRARGHRRLAVLLPFLTACCVSAPIFRPEVPHGNLLFVGAVWMFIALITTWVHEYKLSDPGGSPAVFEAKIEYVKEQSSFWKGISYGLVIAYLGMILSLVRDLHSAVTDLVTSPREKIVLAAYINIELAAMSLFLFVGPVYEASAKALRAVDLLLKLRDTPPETSIESI